MKTATKIVIGLGAVGALVLASGIAGADDRKPVIEPPPPPNPNPGPGPGPGVEGIPLATGTAASFPAGEILATVNTPSGVFIRREPRVVNGPNGLPANAVARAANGVKLAVVNRPISPPTPGAPNGWRAVRTASGIEGFVSDALLVLDPVLPPATAGCYGYMPMFPYRRYG